MTFELIGKKLKKLRIYKNYDIVDIQKQLEKYNVSYSISAIYKWEEGEILPNIETLDILCNIYDCPISYLLEEDYVESKNLTPCEIFLLEQFRYDNTFRKIAELIYKLYLKNQKQKKHT